MVSASFRRFWLEDLSALKGVSADRVPRETAVEALPIYPRARFQSYSAASVTGLGTILDRTSLSIASATPLP